MSHANLYYFSGDATTSLMTKEIIVKDASGNEVSLGWMAKVGDAEAGLIYADEMDALRHAIIVYCNTEEIPMYRL